MIVLGIDPGLTRMGFCLVVDGAVADWGILSANSFDSLTEKINNVTSLLDAKLREWEDVYGGIDELVIENFPGTVGMGSHNMGFAIAVSVFKALFYGSPIRTVTPSEWKKAAGLKGNATKKIVREHVSRITGINITVKEQDKADAFCIANINPQW